MGQIQPIQGSHLVCEQPPSSSSFLLVLCFTTTELPALFLPDLSSSISFYSSQFGHTPLLPPCCWLPPGSASDLEHRWLIGEGPEGRVAGGSLASPHKEEFAARAWHRHVLCLGCIRVGLGHHPKLFGGSKT